MKNLVLFFKSNLESFLFLLGIIFLFLALLNPHIKLQQKLNSYLLVADVTQSMNAEDLKIDGHSVSRLDFTKNLMRKIIDSSPCGTYFSLGIFSSDNIALLLNPVEVCRSYDVLSDAIDHIDWRMAWKGNSRLSYAIHSAENMFKFLPIPSKMIFFTDGEEAPKLNATIKSDLSNVTFGKSVVFVGIGGKKKVPIPRFNATNEMIGYWPITENNSARSGTSTFATALTVKPEPNQNPTVAAAEYDRYLSQLDEDYLKALSIEIGGLYLKGEDSANFYAYIKNQKIQSRIKTDFSFRSVFLALALLFILSTYFLKYWSRAIGMVLSFKYFKYKK